MLTKGIRLFMIIIMIVNLFPISIVFGEEQSEIKMRENRNEEEQVLDTKDSADTSVHDIVPIIEEQEEHLDEESNNKEIADDAERDLVEGSWGTVSWRYDPDAETITLFGGEGGAVGSAPWKSHPTVREIIVEEEVILRGAQNMLFRGLRYLESIRNVEKFEVSGVTVMEGMFRDTSQIKTLDISNWDTSNVLSMRSMFAESSIQVLYARNWDLSKVSMMSYMFFGATQLQEIDVRGWDTSNVTAMVEMFGYTNLTKLTLGEHSLFSTIVDLPAITPDDRYTGRWILQGSDESQSEPIAFSSSQSFMNEYDGTHPGTYVWETVDNLIRGTWGTVPWRYDPDSETITLFGGEGGTVATAPWKTYTTVREIVVEEQVVLPVDSSELFQELPHLEVIKDAGNFDVSGVENMRWMFNQCRVLRELDVSNWNTANVTTMRAMFQRTEQLEVLDVSNWDTSSVMEMRYMFSHAHLVQVLDVSNWDTSNVTDIEGMFQATLQLEVLDVSSWDTSKVTNMGGMFNTARQLEVIDVSNWDTSKVTIMRGMFQSTEQLEALDVSNWDTSSVTDMGWMFSHARQLQVLDVSSWDTSKVTVMTNMLVNTNNLKKLTLGEHSLFSTVVNLPAIVQNEQYTGRWFLEGSDQNNGQKIAFVSSASFMEEYDGTYPGTYLWEEVSIDQLIAELDPVSDQSTSISGRMTEEADIQVITYKNTEGRTVTIEGTSSLVEWGAYQDEDQKVRAFKVRLQDGERLATDSKVSLWIDHISEFIDRSYETQKTVIKGLTYTASATTLSRQEVNRLENEEALFDLILQESRAQAENVLTREDMTDDFRVIETDLTVGTDQDGSYFAVLEVGNKAYQQKIRIDLTSQLDHMRITIPTQMLFTSIYNEKESNRQFESEIYEIRNHSSISVDTYINQVIVKDSAGIVLLEDGESPLDYLDMYSDSDAEESTGLYQNITQPLLQLNLKAEEAEIQLYENMTEKPLFQLPENSYVPLSLTGTFYGDYPRWVIDDTFDQGGYYEKSLTPNYRFILRFVPQE